ncbi:hypothetical protein L3Q82_001844 [Scortum barcoo]|uniref:Uncharacterized protein n=1 Tax=Scortum barcoo TaxID=214431 RepID=A0ACB8W558_9TELE|nr:hypothetical protein L3Q82_001844 [Scortum barcoo]
MSPATPEGKRLWTMFTPTWLERTKQHPSPTLDNRTISPCSSHPRYSPLIQRVKPTVKTIKVWPEGTDSMLQDRFKNTDWNMFTHTDLDQYASSVLDHISTTIDSVTTQKQITMYPNQKPWMNRDVRLLLKARNTAFRSGDAQAYSTAQPGLS